MRVLFFIVVITFLQAGDCGSYKTGIFISDDKLAGRTIIQRNDSIQLESNEKLGTILLQKIKWIDDCSYEIYDIRILKNSQKLPIENNKVKVIMDKLKDSVFNVTIFIEALDFKMPMKIKKVRNNLSGDFFEIVKKYKW